MKKENNKDKMIKELETQVSCFYSLLKVEKELNYSREKENRDLMKKVEIMEKGNESLSREVDELIKQRNVNFDKYESEKETKQDYYVYSLFGLVLNVVLASVIFFK